MKIANGLLAPAGVLPFLPKLRKSGMGRSRLHAMRARRAPSLLRSVPQIDRVRSRLRYIGQTFLALLESHKFGMVKSKLPVIHTNPVPALMLVLPFPRRSPKSGMAKFRHLHHTLGIYACSREASQKTTNGRSWQCRSHLRPSH